MHKQTMKDAIGPPQQICHPNGVNFQYQQQQQQQGYNNQSHESSYGNNIPNGDGYGGMRGGPVSQRSHGRPGFDGRDPSFNRPVIGAEYEPSHLHPPSSQDMDYLNQMRKHQQELQTQESIREEYRMRNRQAERRMPLTLQGLPQGGYQGLSPRSPSHISPLHSPGFGRQMSGPGPQGSNPNQGFHQIPQDTRPRPPNQQMGLQNQQIGGPSLHRSRDQYDFPHHAVRPPGGPGFPPLSSSMSSERHMSHPTLLLESEFEQSMRLLSLQNNDIHQQPSSGSQSHRLGFPHSQSESRRGSHPQSGNIHHQFPSIICIGTIKIGVICSSTQTLYFYLLHYSHSQSLTSS